eukprot:13983611-Alexandrium_andersonii.AAC.1
MLSPLKRLLLPLSRRWPMGAGSAGWLATAARSCGVIALRPVGAKSKSASVALARYSFTPPMMAAG